MDDLDFALDPVDRIRDQYLKLNKVRTNLFELYNSVFLTQLISQATNDKTRFQPVTHQQISVGDLVLLKEVNTKPTNYPIGLVQQLQINDLGEITGAVVLKGATGEQVKRHSSVLIPLLSVNDNADPCNDVSDATTVPLLSESTSPRRRRAAAMESEIKTRAMLQ